jgi:L-alanine-DL-glutamate epimerase-like enolase superfamily enzyme
MKLKSTRLHAAGVAFVLLPVATIKLEVPGFDFLDLETGVDSRFSVSCVDVVPADYSSTIPVPTKSWVQGVTFRPATTNASLPEILMKITSHEILIVDNPLERPFMSGGTVPASAMRHIVLKLQTDEGVEGLGWAFSASQVMIPALTSAIDQVATHIEGYDPMLRDQIRKEIHRVIRWSGPGMSDVVQATISFALWDIAGKALNTPVWKLLGAHTSEAVPTYASGWMWRDYTLDELAETAVQLKERGFTAMKFRCGAESSAEAEAERARVVRDAVGPDVKIMVDINEGWDIPRTMEVARYFEAYDVYWLEDPIQHNDFAGYNQLVNALDIPITTGEYHYGHRPIYDLVTAGAADIVMIDAHHVGGFDPWMKAAAVCEMANRPVATHLSPELAVHLGAATSNLLTVEYMTWSFGLFNESMDLDENGDLKLPQGPGLGVTLNEDTVKAGLVS